MNLNSSVEWFVGANSFARPTSYVRMNSHLQKRHNPLKYQNVFRQQRNIGLIMVNNVAYKLLHGKSIEERRLCGARVNFHSTDQSFAKSSFAVKPGSIHGTSKIAPGYPSLKVH